MNEMQWGYLIDVLARVTELLEEIATNTRPEKVEEPQNQVKGFTTGEKK